jgi:hypothetical protein
MEFEKKFGQPVGEEAEKREIFTLKELEEEVKKLEKPSQKVEFLLSKIDNLLFPEKPIPVEKLPQLIIEGVPIRARYSFIFEIDENTQEKKIKEEKYEINEEFLNRREIDIPTCFNTALHEIRHRIQKFKKIIKKEKFEIFTKEELENFIKENFPQLMDEENYTIIRKYLEFKEKKGDINEEVDAILVGTACEILFRKEKEIPLSKIIEIIGSDRKEEILKIIKDNREIFLEEVIPSKIKSRFFGEFSDKSH